MNKVFCWFKREEILLMKSVRLHGRQTFVVSKEYGNEARHALDTQAKELEQRSWMRNTPSIFGEV